MWAVQWLFSCILRGFFKTRTFVFTFYSFWSPVMRQLLVLLQHIMFNAAGTSQKPPNTRNMSAHGSGSKASKNLPVDEFIKMSVNHSLERFRCSDEKGTDCFPDVSDSLFYLWPLYMMHFCSFSHQKYINWSVWCILVTIHLSFYSVMLMMVLL